MALFSEKDIEKEKPQQIERLIKKAFRFNEKNIEKTLSEPKDIVKVVPTKKKEEEKPKTEIKEKKQKKEKPKKDVLKKKNPKLLGFFSRKKKEAPPKVKKSIAEIMQIV
ncbi:hypothetical protein JDS71_29230, partial [Bacillus cereus]|nr:hypothetical protein [Bacillus cereus]